MRVSLVMRVLVCNPYKLFHDANGDTLYINSSVLGTLQNPAIHFQKFENSLQACIETNLVCARSTTKTCLV